MNPFAHIIITFNQLYSSMSHNETVEEMRGAYLSIVYMTCRC